MRTIKNLLLTTALVTCVANPAPAGNEQSKQPPSVCEDTEVGTFRSVVCRLFDTMRPFVNYSYLADRSLEFKTDAFIFSGTESVVSATDEDECTATITEFDGTEITIHFKRVYGNEPRLQQLDSETCVRLIGRDIGGPGRNGLMFCSLDERSMSSLEQPLNILYQRHCEVDGLNY